MKKPLGNDFAGEFSRWLKATVEYALSTSVSSTGLRRALRDIPIDDPSVELPITDVHGTVHAWELGFFTPLALTHISVNYPQRSGVD